MKFADKVTAVFVEMDSETRIAKGCNFEGARLHIWVDEKLRPEDGPIFKNTPGTPADPHPQTRKLSPDSELGRRLLAEIDRQIAAGDLHAKAKQALAQKAADEIAMRKAQAIKYRKHDAGEALFDALLDVRQCLLNWMEIADDEDKRAYDQRAIDKANKALRAAGWKP